MMGKKADFMADWLPGIVCGLFFLGTSVSTFFLPVFFSEQLHFSGAQIGLLFTMQALSGILVVVPAGLGNDRINSRNLLIASAGLLAIAYFLLGTVRNYLPYVAVFFTWTLSYHLFRLSLDVQVLKTDTGEHTGNRIGLYQGWRFGGLALGTILAGYLIFIVDFKWTLHIAAAGCLLLTIPAWFLPPTPIAKVTFADYKADFKNARVILFMGWLFLFATHWGAEATCYALFLREILGLDLVWMGWYMSVEFTVVMITVLLVGFQVKGNSDMLRLIIIGLALSGIGGVGMIFGPVALSLTFRAVHGIGDGMIFIVFFVGIARLFDVHRMGGNTGLINLVMMSGLAFGALISGPAGDRWGYDAPLAVSGILTLLLILPLVVGPGRKAML